MSKLNLTELAAALDALSDYYQREPLKPTAIKIYFDSLEKYNSESVLSAIKNHIETPGAGRFYPKASDLISHIDGGEVTADMIVAAAKLANTPLGILARIQIGSYDLNHQDAFYLRQRAVECLLLLDGWKIKIQSGYYTRDEISIFKKYGVNATPSVLLTPTANENLEDRRRCRK